MSGTSSPDPTAGVHTETPAEERDGPQYSSLEEWIDDWLAPIALRPSTSRAAWCASWWAHPEAVSRLGTAWMAWEAAWAEGGTAPSRWWAVDWADHWRALSDKAGTFNGCSSDGHRDVSPPRPRTPVPERYKAHVQP